MISTYLFYSIVKIYRWFAKRFLHPDIVAQYEYIFIWDEDLGVDHFNSDEYVALFLVLTYYAKLHLINIMFIIYILIFFLLVFRYMKLVKKHNLEISQPAITSTRLPIYKITMKRHYVEVHKYVLHKLIHAPTFFFFLFGS